MLNTCRIDRWRIIPRPFKICGHCFWRVVCYLRDRPGSHLHTALAVVIVEEAVALRDGFATQ